MFTIISDLLSGWGIRSYLDWISLAATILVTAAICLLLRTILRMALVAVTRRLQQKHQRAWAGVALQHKVPQQLANLIIPIVINEALRNVPRWTELLGKTAGILFVVILVRLFQACLRMGNELYTQHDISKTRPIKGILQVAQVLVYIIAGIIVIAVLLEESPAVLLGGIGAATAVISFVFKDPILGFVSGIQLTGNDMIHIGDWIEVPKYSADGNVIEISMTTVKVRNFDHTITSIPAYALVSDAFINWRGMEETGGRRIKRCVYIDGNSVRLCDADMLASLEKIQLIQDYLQKKQQELTAANHQRGVTPDHPVNTRQITNLGTFRAYMEAYLKQHPGIAQHMTLLVRQRDAGAQGIPLEVYAFTTSTVWKEYEDVQSDIFDHFYSAAPLFGLAIFQQPSGNDIRSIGVTFPQAENAEHLM